MQGFYKNDNDILLWSADRVLNDAFELWLDKKDTYSYPVEGWIWADDELTARKTLQCYGPKPFLSWVLNENTAKWEAPVQQPSDDGQYYWDEPTLSWKVVE